MAGTGKTSAVLRREGWTDGEIVRAAGMSKVNWEIDFETRKALAGVKEP